MSKWKAGSLRSGGTGSPVHSQRQAVAIMLSEKKKADEGDEEYQGPQITKPKGSLKGFGKPRGYHPLKASYHV